MEPSFFAPLTFNVRAFSGIGRSFAGKVARHHGSGSREGPGLKPCLFSAVSQKRICILRFSSKAASAPKRKGRPPKVP
eukprot:6491828-Amphidinium_carterae.1